MNDSADELIQKALDYNLLGWDFSSLKERWVEEPPSWNYKSIVEKYLSQASCLLDMGTGGGEFLSTLENLPRNSHATESYAPNIPLAKRNLEPLGIQVHVFQEDGNLPFKDQIFDLVINRYDSFNPRELYRILKPGGIFITEQVGGKDNEALNQILGSSVKHSDYDWDLQFAQQQLREDGFEIHSAKEEFPETRFFDIGAIVLYLRVIPWQIPGFTVSAYKQKLVKLHDRLQNENGILISSHRFLVIAVRSNFAK